MIVVVVGCVLSDGGGLHVIVVYSLFVVHCLSRVDVCSELVCCVFCWLLVVAWVVVCSR